MVRCTSSPINPTHPDHDPSPNGRAGIVAAAIGENDDTKLLARHHSDVPPTLLARADDETAWLGMSDSNSGIRVRAMYLRYRDNSCWLGQKSPAETIRV